MLLKHMPKKPIAKGRAAFTILEYVLMLIVLIVGLIAFKFYIQRAYQGQMSRAGEGFSHGRLYSPRDTIVCVYDLGRWYSEACYRSQRDQHPGWSHTDGVLACTMGCPAP